MTRLLSTSATSRSSTLRAAIPVAPADRLRGARSVQPPAKTPSRANSVRSSLGRAGRSSSRSSARSVCWRGSAVRLPPVSSRKRSSSRAAISLGGQRAHPRRGQLDRERDAVQPAADLATAGALASVTRNAGCAAQRPLDEQPHRVVLASARSIGSARVRRRREQRRHADRSPRPAARSASRLVARIATPGQSASRLASERRQASTRCSQLSSRAAVALRAGARDRACAASGSPALAHAEHRGDRLRHERGVATAAPARRTRRRRSKSSTRFAATCSARRVLPAPPDAGQRQQPRASRSSVSTSASSRSRPTKLVSCTGRLCGARVERLQRREVGRQRRRRRPGRPAPGGSGPSGDARPGRAARRRRAGCRAPAPAVASESSDLAAVPGGEQPRDAVERRAEVVAVAHLGRAGVQRHPHPERRVAPGHGSRCSARWASQGRGERVASRCGTPRRRHRRRS